MPSNYFTELETLPQGSRLPYSQMHQQLQWNTQGLIPVIAQAVDTGEVLMMAWMNAEALQVTLREGRVCYWSRSRQQLWRKGESSGNHQWLKQLRIDCDGDCLLCLVEQTGPACHTGRPSCFYWQVDGDQVELISSPGSSPGQ